MNRCRLPLFGLIPCRGSSRYTWVLFAFLIVNVFNLVVIRLLFAGHSAIMEHDWWKSALFIAQVPWSIQTAAIMAWATQGGTFPFRVLRAEVRMSFAMDYDALFENAMEFHQEMRWFSAKFVGSQ